MNSGKERRGSSAGKVGTDWNDLEGKLRARSGWSELALKPKHGLEERQPPTWRSTRQERQQRRARPAGVAALHLRHTTHLSRALPSMVRILSLKMHGKPAKRKNFEIRCGRPGRPLTKSFSNVGSLIRSLEWQCMRIWMCLNVASWRGEPRRECGRLRMEVGVCRGGLFGSGRGVLSETR